MNEANGRGDGRCRSPAPSTELWPEVCATVTAGHARLSGLVYFICQRWRKAHGHVWPFWPPEQNLNKRGCCWGGSGGVTGVITETVDLFFLTITRFATLFFFLDCSGDVFMMDHPQPKLKLQETVISRLFTASCKKRKTFLISADLMDRIYSVMVVCINTRCIGCEVTVPSHLQSS